jgi:hypothetical protein
MNGHREFEPISGNKSDMYNFSYWESFDQARQALYKII